MGIGRTAAILAAAAGTVVLGAGAAQAGGGGHRTNSGNSGAQVNNCTGVSSADIDDTIGSPTVSCLNFDRTFGKHHGPQTNRCSSEAAVSTIGNLIFFPVEGPSVVCANIRR
ncbi:hypothetical protein [Streptomyces palmae]|uniref:Secreted protein n=1 Tax=Streptomyces palmae TaxID=1701085 RepID=A0A4Z0GLJ0_9ACTN|nr:hypothetical protein [Streptomyces palmae]TGA96561.1 hypothetical protein E4099_24060 [Streptomyces palmae]